MMEKLMLMKENKFEESDIVDEEFKVEENENDTDVEETKEEIDYQDAEEDDYKPDPAAEQEEDDQNDASDSDDDSIVETTESVLSDVTDDEDQSVQEPSVRRSMRTITRPSRTTLARKLSARTSSYTKQRKITINTSSMTQIPQFLLLRLSRGSTMWYMREEPDLLSNTYIPKRNSEVWRERK
jgi:hypothetical protein